MSNYECKFCNYKTKEKSNLNRHNKSLKHLNKVNNLPIIAKLTSNGTQMEPKWNPNGTNKTK